ncbi:MAG: hypothetical protein Q9227_004399 [Pyrenula ochraceoflavens]
MLYYSERTRTLGNVDRGSTVTDFLPAERARGITIQSAAITFRWPPDGQIDKANEVELEKNVQQGKVPPSALQHSINLIDTPGHADFTFEVRRSLRVLDGAICILDGVAGVEAQTEQVWAQAGEWSIPRLVFVNKLDRDGASFAKAVKEVGVRLAGWPAVCQFPWFEEAAGDFKLVGVADVINLQALFYPKDGDGKDVQLVSLEDLSQRNPWLATELKQARVALVEVLTTYDVDLVDILLNVYEMNHFAVPPTVILNSLRKCLIDEEQRVIPIFAGSSLRNVGVQPLLDAVVNLLPSPEKRPDPEVTVNGVSNTLQKWLSSPAADHDSASKKSRQKQKSLTASAFFTPSDVILGCALAFKVVNDPKKGMLTYIRVYSGSITERTILYNANLRQSEKAQNVFKSYGDTLEPISIISAGQIGVIVGLKAARTGDTLVSFLSNKDVPPEAVSSLQLQPIEVPPPLFYQSIEPDSLGEEKGMMSALDILLREDPSLSVTQNEETGQTLLSGMGDLHLEIARNRLIEDLKAKASLGGIEISYKETINCESEEITRIFEKEILGRPGKAACSVQVIPLDPNITERPDSTHPYVHMAEQDSNFITVSAPDSSHLKEGNDLNKGIFGSDLTLNDVIKAYTNGATAALSRGPKYAYPFGHIHVKLIFDPKKHFFEGLTNPASMASACKLAVKDALLSAARSGSSLLEPVMDVTIMVDEKNVGRVSQDLISHHGGSVDSLSENANTGPEGEQLGIDPNKIYAPTDPFLGGKGTGNDGNGGKRMSLIRARVPLKEMVGYLNQLRSMTSGRGTFVMKVDRFEKVYGHREKALLAHLGAV